MRIKHLFISFLFIFSTIFIGCHYGYLYKKNVKKEKPFNYHYILSTDSYVCKPIENGIDYLYFKLLTDTFTCTNRSVYYPSPALQKSMVTYKIILFGESLLFAKSLETKDFDGELVKLYAKRLEEHNSFLRDYAIMASYDCFGIRLVSDSLIEAIDQKYRLGREVDLAAIRRIKDSVEYKAYFYEGYWEDETEKFEKDVNENLAKIDSIFSELKILSRSHVGDLMELIDDMSLFYKIRFENESNLWLSLDFGSGSMYRREKAQFTYIWTTQYLKYIRTVLFNLNRKK